MSLGSEELYDRAIRRLRDGGLLAYPTETVWGLGADARSEPALASLQRWKGRSTRQPIAVLLPDAGHLEREGFLVPAWARSWIERFWPGPLTLVFPTTRPFAPGVAREDGAVGVRCSSHSVAAALARQLAAAGVGPVTATSLNRSGEPPARTAGAARGCCGPEPEAPRILDPGPDASGGAPSSVVDATGEAPVLLRASGALGPVIESLLGTGNAA